MSDKFSTVVIANGECPTHPIALELLHNARNIVCCDGAVRHLEQLNAVPTAIVGDGDSISEENRVKYAKFLVNLDKSEEYNDLTKAFNYCEANGFHTIAIVGGCGLREDHALANLSLLMGYAERFEVIMVTNYGIFTPILKTHTFQSHQGDAVSVFSFTPKTHLTFHGLKYPVNNRCFNHLWEGSLNEALADKFTVELHDEGRILVYQAFKKENS